MNEKTIASMQLFYKELEQEFHTIIHYWKTYSIDTVNGGFLGERDHYNTIIPEANKGIILNSRLLWSFSAIAQYTGNSDLTHHINSAYTYLRDHFKDEDHGGVWWEVSASGKPVNKKKQTYAQAFTIYGLAQYYLHTKNEDAKNWALSLFHLLETHALDKEKNGYIESFSENWIPAKDMRLSEKDQNGAKTMNTHLHLLEAYTLLYKIHPEKTIENALQNLINLFLDQFLNNNYNFESFLDMNWQILGNPVISFGHDIEAVWLLIEAATSVKNDHLLKKVNTLAIPITERFLEKGYRKRAGIINEEDCITGVLNLDRYWWAHAEALVGLRYAYAISPKEKYLDALLDIWEFTRKHLIDRQNGGWFFRINENYQPYKNEYKLGMWKSPYHNARTCIMLLQDKINITAAPRQFSSL